MNISLFTLYVGKSAIFHADDLRSIKITAEIFAMVKDEPVTLVNNLSGNVIFRG